MEYEIEKGELSVNAVALNAKAEEPINIDITLPDYCPDIQRILKCQIKPIINMRAINHDRLDIDGESKVKLMYMDEDKKVLRCFDYKSPFSISLEIKNNQEDMIDPIIYTDTKIEYVNCRAVSPRRLNVNGAFSVNARILYKTYKDIACSIEDKSIEQKRDKIKTSAIISQTEKSFNVNEVLEISEGKPKIGNIIRTEIMPNIYESKTIAGKLVLKGETVVKVMYKSDIEENDIQSMEYSIPISQILDIDGIEEDSKCLTRISVMDSSVEQRTDSTGEDTLMECEIKLMATVISYKDEEMYIISDVYSKDYELETEYKNITFRKIMDNMKINCDFINDIDTNGKNIKKICCVFNDVRQISATMQKDDICFKGKYNICIIATDENDELMYIEKMIELSHMYRTEYEDENINIDCDMQIVNIDYRMKSSTEIEVKISAEICAELTKEESSKCLDKITADEDKKRIKDENASIIIYYAQKGENIWDIAMKYASSVDGIKEQNNIENDMLSDATMLLIPV